MRKRTMKLISRKDEMALIAAALKQSGGFLLFLRANPQIAKEMGKAAGRSLRSFAATYPGKARTRRVPNAVWAKARHQLIADCNRAMGLKGS